MSATVSVRQAARGDAMAVLARWGLAARAAIYLLIGVLAIALATGSRRGETDQRGAMQELTRHTGGTALVWIIGIGLAGYALWRLSEAAFGVVGEGKKAGPRVQSLARAIIYVVLRRQRVQDREPRRLEQPVRPAGVVDGKGDAASRRTVGRRHRRRDHRGVRSRPGLGGRPAKVREVPRTRRG